MGVEPRSSRDQPRVAQAAISKSNVDCSAALGRWREAIRGEYPQPEW